MVEQHHMGRNLQPIHILAVILLAAVLSLALLTLIADNFKPHSSQPPLNTSSSRSPDRVKESGPPNGDTQPSPTGTGPGSSNSLLGQ